MKIFGAHDAATIQQLERCAAAEDGAPAVLCADGHLGYSMPIGGVVGYREHISPSGVGYDIACGNLAVRTNLRAADLTARDFERIADTIQRRVAFGMGRPNGEPVGDHPVFDSIVHSPVGGQRRLLGLARRAARDGRRRQPLRRRARGRKRSALGWRAFRIARLRSQDGHRVSEHRGRARLRRAHASGRVMDAPPSLLPLAQPSGQDYLAAMTIAGEFAYAGREAVVATVLNILGAEAADRVHNHHNFAWQERHVRRDILGRSQGRDARVSRAARLHRRQHGRHGRDRSRCRIAAIARRRCTRPCTARDGS